MFRVRVAASLFVIMAGLSAGLYFYLGGLATEQTEAVLEARLRVARSSLERSRRLTDHWILARAKQVAEWPQIGGILATRPESLANEEGVPPSAEDFAYQIHVKMNEEVLVWSTKYQALIEGKMERSADLVDWRLDTPDLFVVVDTEGVGVADAKDRAAYGPSEANLGERHPAIKEQVVAHGKPIVDLWMEKNGLLTVAVAPVRHGGRVVGAVVMGYRLSSGEAKRDTKVVGAEVAYFVGGDLSQSSSLTPGIERALQQAIGAQKLMEHAAGDPVEVDLEGKRWRAAIARSAGYASASEAGFAVLLDAEQLQAAAHEPLPLVLFAGGLAFLLSLVAVFLAFLAFVRPIEAIDQGVLEIINGDMDFWFDGGKSELVGTMAQNLNIMVCNLSGRPLPDEEDAG